MRYLIIMKMRFKNGNVEPLTGWFMAWHTTIYVCTVRFFGTIDVDALVSHSQFSALSVNVDWFVSVAKCDYYYIRLGKI